VIGRPVNHLLQLEERDESSRETRSHRFTADSTEVNETSYVGTPCARKDFEQLAGRDQCRGATAGGR